MLTGTGIDLVDVARIERALARDDADLLGELFTPSERAACVATRRPGAAYAAVFAAKEACFKALGTGKIGRMAWTDIDVTPALPASMVLRGETARVAAERGVGRIHVSLAVAGGAALAWVVMS